MSTQPAADSLPFASYRNGSSSTALQVNAVNPHNSRQLPSEKSIRVKIVASSGLDSHFGGRSVPHSVGNRPFDGFSELARKILLLIALCCQSVVHAQTYSPVMPIKWDGILNVGDLSGASPAGCTDRPVNTNLVGNDPEAMANYWFNWINTSCTQVSACQNMATARTGLCTDVSATIYGNAIGAMHCRGTKKILGGVLPDSGGYICPSFNIEHTFVALKSCPDGRYSATAKECLCSDGSVWVPEARRCIPYVDRFGDKPADCMRGYGNPIYPLTASKREVLSLGNWLGDQLEIGYDSRLKTAPPQTSQAFAASGRLSFGELWSSSFDKSLLFRTSGTVRSVAAGRGIGTVVGFIRNSSGVFTPDDDLNDRIIGAPGQWNYIDSIARAEESYDDNGTLTGIKYASGRRIQLTYSDASTPSQVAPKAGLLIKVSDNFGREIRFRHEQPPNPAHAPRVARVFGPDGRPTIFSYTVHGSLEQVTWPDGSTRRMLYEIQARPWALTGILDENRSRVSTYGYDGLGRAVSTQGAAGVNRFVARWATAPSWQIEDRYDEVAGVVWRDHRWVAPQGTIMELPNGQTSTVTATVIKGMPRITSQSQPAGSGCQASASHQFYDSRGNITQRDDFNGNRACYAFDANNREVSRVEGLHGSVACSSVLPNNPNPPAGTRRVSTRWHPDWRLPSGLAEPGRVTTLVYHGQPDPSNSNTPASCAPRGTVISGSKALTLLCRQIEQATTDTTGALGFSALPQAGIAPREQRWTYNAFGQVLTHDGPRINVNDTTIYEYYTSTSFTGTDPNAVGYTLGDLRQVKNAAGQATRFTLYDKLGQVLEMVDPNGLVTQYSYDARQRITRLSAGGLVTQYSYWPTGMLQRVTLPDASWVFYEYDQAQRLVKASDNLGNSVRYVLDNLGNRIEEQFTDPSNSLRRRLLRDIDGLGRIQLVIGRE